MTEKIRYRRQGQDHVPTGRPWKKATGQPSQVSKSFLEVAVRLKHPAAASAPGASQACHHYLNPYGLCWGPPATPAQATTWGGRPCPGMDMASWAVSHIL